MMKKVNEKKKYKLINILNNLRTKHKCYHTNISFFNRTEVRLEKKKTGRKESNEN